GVELGRSGFATRSHVFSPFGVLAAVRAQFLARSATFVKRIAMRSTPVGSGVHEKDGNSPHPAQRAGGGIKQNSVGPCADGPGLAAAQQAWQSRGSGSLRCQR